MPTSMTPDISVVIPVYNASATVERAVCSILGQSGVNVEIIAVDDGSSDNSVSLLQAIAGTDPRLRVISQPNGGPSKARRTGADAAAGEWLFFLDADDIMTEGALSGMLAVAESDTETDMVVSEFMYRQPDGSEQPSLKAPGTPLTGVDYIGKVFRMEGYWTLSVMLRKELMKSVTTDSAGMHFGEDALWKIQLLAAARKVAPYPHPAFIYMQMPDSLSSPQTFTDEKFANFMRYTSWMETFVHQKNLQQPLAESLAFFRKYNAFQRLHWRRAEGLADALIEVRRDSCRFPALRRSLNRYERKILRYFAFGRKLGEWLLRRRLNRK